VYPASHVAGANPSAPPMGARLRLKASKDISGFSAPVQRIFQAMKTYGLIVADNGSDMFVSGVHDTRWNNDILNPAFAALKAGDFEVVQLGWQPSAPPVATSLRVVPPCRILDTRTLQGAPSIAANATRTFVLTGSCGVPAAAVAVSVNVTAVTPQASGDLVFYPFGTGVPNASTLSFRAGRTRANNAQVRLSSDGTGRATVQNRSPGTLDLVVDVNGFYE
jgi:hypothetical protein